MMKTTIVLLSIAAIVAVNSEVLPACAFGLCPENYKCVNSQCVPVDYSKTGPCTDKFASCSELATLCSQPNWTMFKYCPATCKVCSSNSQSSVNQKFLKNYAYFA